MKMHTLRGTANLRTGRVENSVDVTGVLNDTPEDLLAGEQNSTVIVRETLKALHDRIENPDEPLDKPQPAIREHYGFVSECAAARRALDEPTEPVTEGSFPDDVPIEFTQDLAPDAADLMAAAVETYRARGAVYGKSYDRQGDIMQALFPNGVNCKTIEDHRRFGVLTIMISKLARYCNNFATGGHLDSVHDLGVYSFILEELDSRKSEDTE